MPNKKDPSYFNRKPGRDKSVYQSYTAGNVRGITPASANALAPPSLRYSINYEQKKALVHVIEMFKDSSLNVDVIQIVLAECEWKGLK